MKCSACQDWEGEPVYELSPAGKLMPQCPKCGSGLAVAQPAVVVPSLNTPNAGNASVLTQKRTTESDVDVLALAWSRLVAIESEIAVLEKLKAEAARLRRMIAAAEADDNVERPAAH